MMHTVLTPSQLKLLYIAQGFSLLPLITVLPFWLIIYWVFLVVWRVLIERKKQHFPATAAKTVVAGFGILLLVITVPVVISVQSFVAFFVIAFSLKLLELRHQHDALLFIQVCFIALATALLFYQTMLAFMYLLFVIVVILYAWLVLFSQRVIPFKQRLFHSLGIVLQVLPLMLILFLVMPRLGQFWHMPSQSQTGVTGFSDSMSPGDFGRLVESNDIAFRVTFEQGPIPSASQRYWRALVLDTFDGRTWKKAKKTPWQSVFRSPSQLQKATSPHSQWRMLYLNDNTPPSRYSILLEPHQQPWLFSLMAPVQAESSSLTLRFTEFASLSAISDIAARASYTVTSHFDYRYSPKYLSKREQNLLLQLPQEDNLQALAYGQRLREQYRTDDKRESKIITAVLNLYHQSFRYTLNPEPLGANSIDAFLFSSQSGFCEHFASSFVFLMRAAGIPARVVIGYQGGEFSPNNNYFIVRQRDAHAWAEVWIEGEGWQRVDPTAAVAPERIEQGLNNALTGADADRIKGHMGQSMLFWMQLRLDALSYNWHRWVLSYDTQSQYDFFRNVLGGSEVWRIALFFIISIAAVIACYFLYIFWPKKRRYIYDETVYYQRHVRLLAKHGFNKGENETAMHFALRVAKERPEWRQELVDIAEQFQRLAYGSDGSIVRTNDLKAFANKTRRWPMV